MKPLPKVAFHAEIFCEDDTYIGLCPELNVSGFGDAVEEAKHSLHETVEAFIEDREVMQTLEEVMEKVGFVKEHDTWVPRKPVAEELLSVE